MKIVWTERAIADLLSIGEYIAKDNPVRARQYVEKLIQRIRQIKFMPESGRIVPEYDHPSLRELIEGSYRIIYKLEKRRLVIIKIFEAHRRMPH